MPQYMPGAPGLYPYKGAGINHYEGVGNILSGLMGAMALYKQGKQENRTLQDMVGTPPAQFNPARGYPSQPQGIREMFSGMSPLAALRGDRQPTTGFGAPPQPPSSGLGPGSGITAAR